MVHILDALKREIPRLVERGTSGCRAQLSHESTQANHKATFGLLQDKKPSMRRVLRELQIRYTETKVTSWQRVVCPVCSNEKASVILQGRRGEGWYVCNDCGTRGDSISLFRFARRCGFREACAHFDAWGML